MAFKRKFNFEKQLAVFIFELYPRCDYFIGACVPLGLDGDDSYRITTWHGNAHSGKTVGKKKVYAQTTPMTA